MIVNHITLAVKFAIFFQILGMFLMGGILALSSQNKTLVILLALGGTLSLAISLVFCLAGIADLNILEE